MKKDSMRMKFIRILRAGLIVKNISWALLCERDA